MNGIASEVSRVSRTPTKLMLWNLTKNIAGDGPLIQD